jgi:viroplasmin and RNaseH domain-containing protein
VFIDGYKNNKHKGFKTLEEAKEYMEANGESEYSIIGGPGGFASAMATGIRFYYAVANGRQKGIYECYQYGNLHW